MRAAVFASLLLVSSVQADEIDDFLQREMARNHIPGAAVAVVKDGKLVKLAAYGVADLENNVPVSVQSAFQIASSTKLFTSTLLMQLAGEGRIELDAPVSRYVPEAPDSWRAITVRQLAAHASGMPPGPPNADTPDAAAAVKAALLKPLAKTPGEVSAYGSDDFSVLTYIIEKTGGKTLPELIAERITRPLGMSATRFDNAAIGKDRIVVSSDIVPNRVSTYQWKDGAQQSYRFLYPSYTISAGGMFSSAQDLGAFLLGISASSLLAQPLQEKMWIPYQLNSGKPSSFSLGWTVSTYRGERQVGHSGGPALADVVWYPAKKLGIVVLTNQRRMSPVLAHGVANFYLAPPAFLKDAGIADGQPKRTEALKPLLLALANGKADGVQFSDPALAAELNEWFPKQLGAMPPLSRLVLLSDSGDERAYRAVHGATQSVRWTVKYGKDGKISELDLADE
jgi:CubicO group peptidase (beta-lactamase class C family)